MKNPRSTSAKVAPKKASTEVEFSFDCQSYEQIDGVAKELTPRTDLSKHFRGPVEVTDQ